MSLQVEHNYRFDAAGKLDSDDWVLLPRADVRPDFVLDDALADEMARRYFEAVQATSPIPVQISSDAQGVRYLVPLNKTAVLFAEPERSIDAQRAETSWLIAGGFMLAHHVSYGGRFYIGAEWDPSGALKLYSSIRRYPPRLLNWFGIRYGVAVYQRTQKVIHQRAVEKFLRDMAARVGHAAA